MEDSLLQQLCRSVVTRPIAATELSVTATFVMDAVCAMVGGMASEETDAVRHWYSVQAASAPNDAFLFGALSNALEMDAMDARSGVHPGTVIVPAALAALGEHPIDGPRFLAAVLQGSEIALRIGSALDANHRRRWQPTSTCAAFGAAWTVGKLLGLSHAERISAMGNVGSTAGGLWAFLDEQTRTKQWHAGRAAESSIRAAQLARFGLTGPAFILENSRGFFPVLSPDSDPTTILAPDDEWRLLGVAYKPWPSPRPTHAAITAACRLHGRVDIDAIRRVELKTYAQAVQLCGQLSHDTAQKARFSLTFCTAAALRDGSINAATFEDQGRKRHASLAALISMEEDPALTRRYPAESPASLTVVMADGSTVVGHTSYALGDPQLPLGESELEAKARRLLSGAGMSAEAQVSFIDRIVSLTRPGSAPREITDALRELIDSRHKATASDRPHDFRGRRTTRSERRPRFA